MGNSMLKVIGETATNTHSLKQLLEGDKKGLTHLTPSPPISIDHFAPQKINTSRTLGSTEPLQQ